MNSVNTLRSVTLFLSAVSNINSDDIAGLKKQLLSDIRCLCETKIKAISSYFVDNPVKALAQFVFGLHVGNYRALQSELAICSNRPCQLPMVSLTAIHINQKLRARLAEFQNVERSPPKPYDESRPWKENKNHCSDHARWAKWVYEGGIRDLNEVKQKICALKKERQNLLHLAHYHGVVSMSEDAPYVNLSGLNSYEAAKQIPIVREILRYNIHANLAKEYLKEMRASTNRVLWIKTLFDGWKNISSIKRNCNQTWCRQHTVRQLIDKVDGEIYTLPLCGKNAIDDTIARVVQLHI